MAMFYSSLPTKFSICWRLLVSWLCSYILWHVSSRSLPHYTLDYLVLSYAFFLLSHTQACHSSLTGCLSILSFQRPWVSSWPVAALPPDTASNKSCPGCASTAVTQTCVTAPPPGIQAHSTSSVHCSASFCWGCGCDITSLRRTALD